MSQAFAFLPESPPRVTLAAFMAMKDDGGSRKELVDGRVYAMAPGTVRHAGIANNFGTALNNRLKPPCWALAQAGLIASPTADHYLVPDVVVSCTPAGPNDLWVRNPRVVVEVLSPSTLTHDRGAKLPLFRAMPTVRAIFLVSSDAPRVEAWHRAETHWVVLELEGLDAEIRVDEPELVVPMREIYRGVFDVT